MGLGPCDGARCEPAGTLGSGLSSPGDSGELSTHSPGGPHTPTPPDHLPHTAYGSSTPPPGKGAAPSSEPKGNERMHPRGSAPRGHKAPCCTLEIIHPPPEPPKRSKAAGGR